MKGFCLEISGPYACFTRPEMKVERVSYDVITPSAARAIFEAVLWKPAIRWRITQIEVLSPIRWISIRRNEVASIMRQSSGGITIEDDRQQRAALILTDVRYRVHATFDLIKHDVRPAVRQPVPDWLADSEEQGELIQVDVGKDETEGKYAAMFERRAKRGQCFHRPYLGCREFACDFELIVNDQPYKSPIEETRDLGWMIYDMDFNNAESPRPMFYRPELKAGIIAIPHPESEEVRR